MAVPRRSGIVAAMVAAAVAGFAPSCSVPDFGFQGDVVDGGGLPLHCANGSLDPSETDTDCGGNCRPCGLGQGCAIAADCAQGDCVVGRCQDAGCVNGAVDGEETGLDCGGGRCQPCPPGEPCALARDCQGKVCSAGSCAQPTCDDDVLNGGETGVDCGGDVCPKCLAGQPCKLSGDCASGSCINGTCSIVCIEGKGDCDGDATNGCEVNLKTTPEHCDRCGAACNLPHAIAGCSGGACVVASCALPYADCDGQPENGCEVNTSSEASNCGECGSTCSALNGTPYCANGRCQITCAEGFSDCDDDRANGCEKSVASDVNNCGMCGKVCQAGNGTPWCVQGRCGVSSCPPGFGDCNGNPDDGCEIDLRSDENNCQSCGNLCLAANGTAECTSSACRIASCANGFDNCNAGTAQGYSDGCETATSGNVAHCGRCNNACAIANATPKCETGSCKVGTCTAPWADCDNNQLDCETNTSTSKLHCGGCGTSGVSCDAVYGALHASGKCVSGGCQFDRCATGYTDCNMQPDVDGCEADRQIDENNCGTCGSVCQAPYGSNTCTTGACVPGCGTQFGNCDANNSNGCEITFATDANNCGGCRIRCLTANASGTSCVARVCKPRCNTGWGDCDNPVAGCTTPLDTVQHCGSCTTSCQSPAPFCVNRACANHLPITLVNSATSGAAGSAGLTLNHVLERAAGNHRLVAVIVGTDGNTLAAAKPDLARYNGVNLTLAHEVWSNNRAWTGIYVIGDDALPVAPGTYAVQINGAEFGVVASVLELANVEEPNLDPLAPIDATAGSPGINCANDDPNDDVVVVSADAWILTGVVTFGSGLGTPSSGQVETHGATSGNIGFKAGYLGPVPAGSRNLAWNMDSCNASAQVLVALKPAFTP